MFASEKKKFFCFPAARRQSVAGALLQGLGRSVESRFDELSEEVLQSCLSIQLRVILKMNQPVSAAASDKVINADISS